MSIQTNKNISDMKTTTKEVKAAIQNHIVKAIDFVSAGYDDTYTNDVKSVWRAYKQEAGPLRGNLQDHFIDFIQGLPSYFNLPYYYNDITDVMANEFNLPQPANKDEQDTVKLYHALIFRELTAMLRKEGVNIYQ
jgi:hypothetical protein